LSSNDSAGLNLYGPPVVGQALAQYWQNDSAGWTLQTNATVGAADFAGQLEAVSIGLNVVVLSTVTNGSCGNGFSATRTWQAMDGCSNVASCSQTVSVEDQTAPTILIEPSSMAVAVGANADLAVSVLSCPPLGYQWYFNGTNRVDQQTNAMLVLSNVSLDLAGSYTVVVTNSFGSITSAPAQLAIGFAPLISSNPTNEAAAEGDSVSFGVGAQGSAPLSYQWYFNGMALGAETNPMLELSVVTAAQVGDYQVVVTNAYGSVTSASAHLSVAVPIVVCGANRTVELGVGWDFDSPVLSGGTNAVLSLLGTMTNAGCGGTYSATRSWMVSDATGYSNLCSQTISVVDTTPPLLSCPTNRTVVYGSGWTFDSPSATDLDGVTVAVLSTQTNATCGIGFTATRTWQAVDGCSNVSTCNQTITVLDQGPPTILLQPQTVAAQVGATVDLEITASSCPPLGYQWYFNVTNSLDQQTNETLILSNVTFLQAGSYQVVVSNTYGSVTSTPALLSVGFAPTILTNPTNQIASQGDTVSFMVAATGTDPLAYQWYFNATNLIQGATGSGLELFNVVPGQSGDYSVVVANDFGSVTSTPALMVVSGPPQIIFNPSDQIATNRGSANFTVTAQGTPFLSYQWYFDDTNRLTDATNDTLALSNLSPTQAGNYSVIISNSYGSLRSAPAQLDVLMPIKPVDLVVSNGATATFTSSVLGPGPLAYQWYFNLTNGISDGTNAVLRLTNVAPANLGLYSVSVSNSSGSVATQNASLRVLVAPQILSITSTGGVVTLTFSTVPNLFYEIYYKTNILDPQWLGLPKKANVLLRLLGTGSPMSAQDVIGNQQRFYTVIAQ